VLGESTKGNYAGQCNVDFLQFSLALARKSTYDSLRVSNLIVFDLVHMMEQHSLDLRVSDGESDVFDLVHMMEQHSLDLRVSDGEFDQNEAV
jgi:hypothetical protein